MGLNSGQAQILRDAVNWFKFGSEQVFEIDGLAGTGKTYLMNAILQELQLNLSEYLAMAYTGQASIVMRTRGFITARTIHSSLYEPVEEYDKSKISSRFGTPYKHTVFKLKKALDPNICLFFIDEAYMVPDYMVKDILSFGIKIIVCGDAHQLPPINANPAFLTGPNVHHLTELMRQASDNPILYIASRAIKGLPIHNGIYGNNVMVINEDEFTPEMIKFADCICCGTNKTRDILNSYIRQLFGYTTQLPMFGERVICRNNNWQYAQDDIALANGLTGIVTRPPDVNNFNGSVFTMNFKPDLVDTMFFDVPVNHEYFVSPYDKRQSLKEFEKRYQLPGEFFEFAYALTCHLCQGSEYNNLIYIEEFMRPQIMNQLNYTGITRAKKNLIYVKKINRYFQVPKVPTKS